MKRVYVSFLIALMAFVGCTVKENAEKIAQEQSSEESCLVSGEVIVEFTDEMIAAIESDLSKGEFLSTKSSVLNGAFDNLRVTSVERMYPDAGKFEPRHREAGLHKWYLVKYERDIEVTKASASLSSLDGINYSEPVREVKPLGAVFNDPLLSQQWHYINDGSLGSGCVKGCDINVQGVWENFSAGKAEVIVSVVDGGIDLNHEDLKDVCLPGGKNGSRNFVDGNYTIYSYDHGTHVAGTIGAINNNGKGVCGIAGGKDGKGGVRLMSCQVFKYEGSKTRSAANFGQAIIWGADHGAVISQNSWGNVYDTKEQAAKGGVGSMKAPIDYFINYAGLDENGNQVGPMKGGVVIFAAGNDAWPDGWPAEYSAVQPYCISVGAVASNFNRAYYSNYGDWVTICAPGGDVAVGYHIVSTVPGNAYGKMQGTSMACPHVSGVAALIVSQYGGIGFTNKMLLDRLVGNANRKAIPSTAKIGPLVDATASVSASVIPPDKVSDFTQKTQANNIDFKWKVTKDADSGKAYGYLLAASEDQNSINKLDPNNIPSGVYTAIVEVGSAQVGDEISGRISDLKFLTNYYTAIFAYDYSHNWSASSPVKSIKTAQNNPPVITTDYSGDYKLKAHETLRVVYTISDPDGHDFAVTFNPGSEAATLEKLPDNTYRMTIVGTVFPGGKVADAKIIATDLYGAATSKTINYEILKNHAPVLKKKLEDMFFENTAIKRTINMDEYIYDEDGEQLKYTVKSSPLGIVTLNQVENVLNLTTLDFGLAQVTIEATDACKEKSVFKFQVMVRDPKSDPDVYPNPVKTILKVSDGTSQNLKVTISGSTGVELVVKEGEASSFNPIEIDMTSFAPGRYDVKVQTPSRTVTKTVVKI